MIQNLLSDLARPIANIVHIGAGDCDELPAYLDAGARAVLLVEANPEVAAELEGRVGAKSPVSVVTAAVSANTKKRAFRHTNFPELDSFRPATGVKELFPGLRILSQEPVVPRDPVKVLEALTLDKEGCNLLVLETPGETLGILQALQAADLLLRFDAIRLREGRTRLYEGGATAPEVRDYLTEQGFSAALEAAPEDPDRPYLDARLDRVRLALVQERDRLAQTVKEAEARLEKLTGEKETLRKEAEGLRKQLAEAREQIATLGLAREEVLKAEGQIRLLSDLLLNGTDL